MSFVRWFALAVLGWAAAASAHLTPNSEIRLDFGRSRVAAEIVIPLGELGYALGRTIPVPLRGAEQARLRDYLLASMALRAPDGRRWSLKVDRLTIVPDGFAPDLVAVVTATPPPGAPLRVFDLDYGAVIARVPNHFVLVLARNDFAGGRLSDHPAMIGGLQSASRTLRVDRGPGSAWRGFVSAIGLGMHHIAEGHDHLLFLIALLIPAPLVALGARWDGYAGLGKTTRKLVAVVSAFTVGHSLTLIGGAFFGWTLPARPVEAGIALSILVSAIHALRPLFAGREAFVAGGFGLIHGLAFATLIGRFGLEPLQKAQSILGFNLGIELVQLGVVAAVMPALIMLAHTRFYRPFRLAGGGFAAIAAAAWLVERTSGAENPLGRAIDVALGQAPWLAAALTLVSAALFLRHA